MEQIFKFLKERLSVLSVIEIKLNIQHFVTRSLLPWTKILCRFLNHFELVHFYTRKSFSIKLDNFLMPYEKFINDGVVFSTKKLHTQNVSVIVNKVSSRQESINRQFKTIFILSSTFRYDLSLHGSWTYAIFQIVQFSLENERNSFEVN